VAGRDSGNGNSRMFELYAQLAIVTGGAAGMVRRSCDAFRRRVQPWWPLNAMTPVADGPRIDFFRRQAFRSSFPKRSPAERTASLIVPSASLSRSRTFGIETLIAAQTCSRGAKMGTAKQTPS
jgi:hypothetical protein